LVKRVSLKEYKIMDDIEKLKKELSEWPDSALDKAINLLELNKGQKLTVIDVGAHFGETLVGLIGKINCGMQYISFEPDESTFKKLESVCNSIQADGYEIKCNCMAAGPMDCWIGFQKTKASEVSGILKPVAGLSERVLTGDHEVLEEIRVIQIKIDTVISHEKITHVDILKVDAEGYDLKVLQGANNSLKNQKVGVVICEVFFVAYREGQAYFWDIAKYLEECGYKFVNLFDARETKQGRLYTANGVWVSEKIGKKNCYL
jgi:FkbM family methyltransferase